MVIDPSTLSAPAIYKLLMGVIVPRPIAWVTSLSNTGVVNAAPFSSFCSVSTDPPMIGINIGRRGRGLKDTARNITARGEFVVNIADESMVEKVHSCGVEYPAEVSELAEIGLATLPSETMETPGIAVAPVQLECILHQVLEFGHTTQFFVGQIKRFRIRDDLYRDGKVVTAELRPLARVAGPVYAKLGEMMTLAPIALGPSES